MIHVGEWVASDQVNVGPTTESPPFEASENVTMFGHAGLVRKTFKRMKIAKDRPPVVRLSRVIAHPSYTALYNEHGAIIPESSMFVMPPNAPSFVREKFLKAHARFEPPTIDTSKITMTTDRGIVFGGAAHAHYGHFLLDGMNRFWFHSDRPTLYLNAHTSLLGYGEFISELLSLSRRRTFYQLDRPTLFSEVVMPHASVQSGFLIYRNADAEHLAIAATALSRARRRVAAKVYLSRRGIGNRKCHGEEELERALSSYGFDIVRPERLSVIEQIAMFNSADWIIGAGGSAFHNLLFCPRGSPLKTVQLTWAPPNIRFPLIDRLKGQQSFYARTMSAEAHNEHGVVTATRVDVEQTLSVLRAIGALEPRRYFGYWKQWHSPKRALPKVLEAQRVALSISV